MLSYQHRKSHGGDKMVVRSSYLHHGISYTGKMASLYWIRAQDPNSKLEFVDRWSTRTPPSPTAKIQTTHVTLTIELLTSKWYTTHHLLMGCICGTYEYNPWNRQQAIKRTRRAGHMHRQTDGHSETDIPHTTSLSWGDIIKVSSSSIRNLTGEIRQS